MIETKRFKLPLKYSLNCPKCGALIKDDLYSFGNYISYPVIGEENTISVFCEQCQDYFVLYFNLKVDIELVKIEEDG